MEPAFIQPLTEEQLNQNDESMSDDDTNEIRLHTNILNAVEELRLGIYALKRKMFYELVSNDTRHNAGDMGSMITFHSLFLQAVSYWIGLLDSKPTPPPTLPKKLVKDFKSLTNAIDTVAHEDSDARVLVYNLLFSFSTQHPFDLGEIKKEVEE